MFVGSIPPFRLAAATRRGDPNPMIRDPPLDQCLLKQGLAPGPGDRKCAGKLRTVVCLDRPDRKRRRFDRPLRKVFGADGTVLRIHFPVCPARAFVLCVNRQYFFAVYYAIAGRMLYVHPNLLPGVRGRPGLFFRGLRFFPSRTNRPLVRLKQPQLLLYPYAQAFSYPSGRSPRYFRAYRRTGLSSSAVCFLGKRCGARGRSLSLSSVPPYRFFHLRTVFRPGLCRFADAPAPWSAAYFSAR